MLQYGLKSKFITGGRKMTTTSVIPSDQTFVELQGREYGVVSRPHEKFFQELPPSLVKVGKSLETESALLALADNPVPTKEQIFEAYGKDLNLFKSRHSEFRDCLKQAVRYSIIVNTKSNQEEETKKVWGNLEKEMPAISNAPILELSYIRASKEASVLLMELKTEVGLGIERLLRVFALWLQELVEAEFIGLVEWTADDVCRYHYFHQRASAEVLKKETVETHNFDGSQLFGERNTNTTVKRTETKRSRFLVRHVHHIINAKLHPLGKYKGKKPARVKGFLSMIPGWLKPHLQIVDGTITMEEQIKLKIAETTTTEEEIISAYKYSPGVLLEPFNLIGWNSDDIEKTQWWPKKFSYVFTWILIAYSVVAILVLGPWKATELLKILFRWIFG